MDKISKVLKVPVEAIKNFDEAATVNYIANTFNGNSGNYMNFNPLDKVVELYERLLASEEGKKLSSKERRQLRNKVSARAFRSRRKGTTTNDSLLILTSIC